MFATEPEMAREWADHTPDIKALPERAGTKKEKKGLDSMSIVAQLGQAASALPYVEKLAHDAEISKDLVYRFAEMTQLTPVQFVKAAYADVDGFIDFLKVVSGAATPQQVMTKKAATPTTTIPQLLLKYLGNAGKATMGMGPLKGGFAGASSAGKDPLRNVLSAGGWNPIGHSDLGRSVTGAAAGTGAIYGAGQGINAMTGGGAPQQAAPQQQAPKAEGAKVEAPAEGAKASPQENMGRGAASTGAGQGNNMSPAAKALLMGGGAAALGGGAYMLANRRKKKDKQASDVRTVSINAMKRAIEKKAQELYRNEAAGILCNHLDIVAKHVSLEKQASLRTVQRAVASGKDLSMAIKLAYPHLSGEQRGILAHKMCEAAVKAHQKRASAEFEAKKKVKTQKMESFSGPPNKALQAVK